MSQSSYLPATLRLAELGTTQSNHKNRSTNFLMAFGEVGNIILSGAQLRKQHDHMGGALYFPREEQAQTPVKHQKPCLRGALDVNYGGEHIAGCSTQLIIGTIFTPFLFSGCSTKRRMRMKNHVGGHYDLFFPNDLEAKHRICHTHVQAPGGCPSNKMG